VRSLVKAAGTVPWRPSSHGPEVLVVHRPHYDDWSLPKGKLDPGEGWMAAALRETQEEAGMVGELGAELCGTGYMVAAGPKLVRYWLLRVVEGRFEPHREVDQIRWLGLADARRGVSHRTDRVVLDSAAVQLGWYG
jgi:8-oxo-dGTP pyrophosphatase MutT (NUDIX family)